nr:lysosomal Pro-X carboxypeptidase-like [Rhipicephalus microplus]
MPSLRVAASVVLLLLTLAPPEAAAQQRNLTFKIHNFTTKVDHFSYRNNDTFQMRYIVADQYWDRKRGLILFYPGNEMRIEPFVYSTGIMWDWARYFSGLLVFAEHRYYGESLPYGEESFKDLEHMSYLSSEQAMADYAALLTWLKDNLEGAKNCKVVAIGGSYGGMLAALMRVKYPYIVEAALASSAPFRMFPGLGSCDRYYRGVTEAFEKSSLGCSKDVSRTWTVLDKLGSTPEGCKTLQETFRTCQLLEPSNYPDFRNWIRHTYSVLATINYPFAVMYRGLLPARPVKKACAIIRGGMDTEERMVHAVADVVKMLYNSTGNNSCNNIYPTANMHAYKFQRCTELIHPTCTDGVNDMFYPQEWDAEKFAERCRERFGVTPEFDSMLKKYPIPDFQAASQIFFTDGDKDPWAALGLGHAPTFRTRYHVIEGAAHHVDLQFAHRDDPWPFRKARSFAKRVISNWIQRLP